MLVSAESPVPVGNAERSGAFADYVDDPYNVFMTRDLETQWSLISRGWCTGRGTLGGPEIKIMNDGDLDMVFGNAFSDQTRPQHEAKVAAATFGLPRDPMTR